ncbi:MAG: hypothetical protein U5M50_12620 [Sphingobium sp.]|nr:hypothetical protein [Sphingobium sp.]
MQDIVAQAVQRAVNVRRLPTLRAIRAAQARAAIQAGGTMAVIVRLSAGIDPALNSRANDPAGQGIARRFEFPRHRPSHGNGGIAAVFSLSPQ